LSVNYGTDSNICYQFLLSPKYTIDEVRVVGNVPMVLSVFTSSCSDNNSYSYVFQPLTDIHPGLQKFGETSDEFGIRFYNDLKL